MTRNGSDQAQHLLEAVIEHFDEKIKVVTDGHVMLAEKIDRVASELRSEMREQGELLRTEMRAGDAKIAGELRAEIHAGDTALRQELSAFRTEVKTEFTELRAMMKLSYAEIDARFTRLESTVGELLARVDRLEGRTAS